MLGDSEGSGVIFSFSGQPGVGQLGGERSLRVGVNAHFQKEGPYDVFRNPVVTDSGARLPGLKSWLCLFLAVGT